MEESLSIPFGDISFQNKIGDGPNSTTYYSFLTDKRYKCAAKVLKENTDSFNENYLKYIQILKNTKHHGIIPFRGFCTSKNNIQNRNILVFNYAPNLSLQHVLDQPRREVEWFDLTRKFIIIYGVAQTMNYLHKNNIFHGRLTPSNILIDKNFEPKISDINFAIMLSDTDLSIDNLKKFNLYYYIDPYTLNNNEITGKSDVYSFAIIALQVLSDSTNIYDVYNDDIEELIQKIKMENIKPMIPSNFPNEIKELLNQCFNEDPFLRPHFEEICTKLESIISSLTDVPSEAFMKYKEKIEDTKSILLDEIEEFNSDDEKFKKEEEEEVLEQNYQQQNDFTKLIDDSYFDEPDIDLTQVMNQIEQDIFQTEEFYCDDPEEIEKLNFVQTDEAKKRLQKLVDYINVNVPVLLEGPTGTSKTLSSEIVCKALHLDLIRFNLSSETKTQDLIGRYVGDENSWAGISMKDGPFFEAFTKGKVLLLDEINLAPPSVLQCIEEALDSGYLSIEIPGRPLKSFKRHEKFRLIATQNPNKGLFSNKRQNLGLKFYSRFQVINFPAFTGEELEEIGLKLAHKFNYFNDIVVKEIVKFHMEWSDYREKENDPQCITIREIAAAVNALGKNENVYETIMTIYGARYQKKLKEELKEKLNHYPHLLEKPNDYIYPQFPGCYMNESLKSATKSILFSFKHHHHVILTGKSGCGKTQLAIWASEYYNNSIKNNIQGNEESFFCVCTEEIKVADLVGHSSPSGKSDGTNELIIWQDGFLTKAIKQGKCCVLESLDEAPATVTERINGLLDQKYDNQTQYFDIPESTSCPQIPIDDDFRILATCNIDKISKLSPALLNRFDIIVLENQIDDNINKSQFENMIKTILDRYCISPKEVDDKPEDQESNKIFEELFVFQDDEETNVYNQENENENESSSFNYSENIISLIWNKLKDEKNISYISKICKAIIKLSLSFQQNDNITEESIVNFVFKLFGNNKNFIIQESIEDHLIKMLRTNTVKNNDAPFFYLESPALKGFFAKLMAYSLIEQPVCITGPTGVGKTSASRAFSMIRPRKSDDQFGFQFHSFHSGTKVSHFFGTTVLSNGEIQFHDGTLTTALKKGLVFIADEFNLSTQSVMKSLALALDPTIGKNAFIPGTGQNISISSEFFFIACQNEIGTIGRNAIPDSIIQRFIEIDYPEPAEEDIQKICVEIAKDNMHIIKKDQFNEDDEKLAKNIGNYMIQLNALKLTNIPQWSLRDITKLFKRIFNEENHLNFIGITPYHHILFYTLSSVSPKDAKNTIDNIKTIMKISFGLKDEKLNDLLDCYNAIPEIRYDKQGYFIMKKDAGISIENIKNSCIDKELPTYWNTIFNVSLADEREPILLMGNSGFKTFLANQFLQSAQIITLNQETTVAQLLGTSGFMTIPEAKLFYIEYICKILQQDSLIIEIRNKWEKNELTSDEIEKLITRGKKSIVPPSFHYALDHLTEMLFNNTNNHVKESILSNTVIEFRPGLFFDAILQRQSLILKDLSNLPTIVLERFNELFSGRQNLTISEDIHNTFTKENEKELTDFNTTFRVFATCPSNSPTKLSEAVLSRFSVIHVPEYSLKEQESILKSYIPEAGHFNSVDINKMIDFAESYNKKFKSYITFPQMIKIIELTALVNKATSVKNQNLNLGIVLYRFLGGLLESKEKRNILFDEIKNVFEIPEIYKENNTKDIIEEESVLSVETKFDKSGIVSKMSNLLLEKSYIKQLEAIVAFTKSFNDLIDLIHLSLIIHNPIILEGSPGQGKHTAINYIAEILNIEVIQITISQSTKVEDLFGKDSISRKNDEIHIEMVETEFIKIIKSGYNYDKKAIIILENINNATPAVLNALVPIFDTKSSKILLPNGTTLEKGQFDIIGIFNTNQISSSRDKLPSSLINSSFYYIVSKPTENEIYSIILTKFSSQDFSEEESKRFYEAYIKARTIYSNEGNSFELFSLNDIQKYLLFRSKTKEFFDETTILQMIFAYKFSTNEMIQKILDLLNLEIMKFNPIFSYNRSPVELNIRINNFQSDNDYSKTLSLKSKIKDSSILSILSKIDTLTLPQKHCLIFLACSILSKRACVIQGDTASGKSYLVRLFSELLGTKLIVFQMNNDSNISMLAGQSILNDSISDKDVHKFKKSFNTLCKESNIREYFNDASNNIDIEDSSTWTPKAIKNLLNYLKTIEPKIKDTEHWSEISNSIQIIKETMNPINRFHHQRSEFINAMLKGYWVLIDGIESAPSTIAEKIASLCNEKPELNLFEFGQDYYFTVDSDKPKNKINENFHLFITYNPHSMKESQMIDQTFLTKSFTFTLPQMDEKVDNSAQILFGSLINQSYPKDLSKELASHIAIMHEYAKNESLNNPDNFAGDIPYHGRILTFIMKAFSFWKNKYFKNITVGKDTNLFFQNISKLICFIINSFYINSFSTKKDLDLFRSNCIKKLKQSLKFELINSLQTIGINLKEVNKPVLMILRNIQKDVIFQEDYHYSLLKLLSNFSFVKISNVYYVRKHIMSTIEIIQSYLDSKEKYKIKYGTLYIIQNIAEQIEKPEKPIKKEHTSLLVKDIELRNDDSIISPLSKLDLLNELLSEKLFSEESSFLLDNKSYLELISIISKIVSDKQKCYVFNLFQSLNINNIDFVDKIFPYKFFKNSNLSLLSYWIPLIKLLIQKNIHFSVTLDDQKVEFNKSSNYDLIIYLEMIDENYLSLSKGSQIKYDNAAKSVTLPQKNDQLVFYMIFDLVSNLIFDQKLDFKSKFRTCYLNADKKIKNHIAENYDENKVIFMKAFFLNQNASIISMLWNIVYTFSSKQIQDISLILNSVESRILTTIFKMFCSVNKKNINEIITWCKWAEFLDKYKVNLLKYEDDTENSISNIETSINNVQRIIQYLHKSPDKSKKYWDSTYFIEYCKKEYERLITYKAERDNQLHELKIKKKIIELSNSLDNIKFQTKYDKMKKEIVNVIKDINEYTEDKYKFAKNMVDQFIKISSNDQNEEKTFINWPIENTNRSTSQTKNIQLFELLIWYSKIKSILKKIKDKKDILSNLRKLGDFQEMEYAREILLTHLIQNSKIDKPGLTNKDKKEARYLLEAHMLAKLFNINESFITSNTNIYNIINNYMNRESSNESEIQWIYMNIKNFSPDLILLMPKIKPNALVFLVVNKKNDNEYIPGPLFEKNIDVDMIFLKDQAELMHNEFKTFREAAQSIAKNAYYSINISDNSSKDYESLKTIFCEKPIGEKSIIERVISFIFFFAENLENWSKPELLFEDISFLQTNWDQLYKNEDLLNKYPSLLFWIYKNEQCAKQIMKTYGNFEKKDTNKIPLWLIFLRILSSMNCIKFDSNSQTQISEIIRKETSQIIIKFLHNQNKKINYENYNYNWLNLLISNSPQAKSNIKIIHDFLSSLSLDRNKNHSPIIQQKKISYIRKLVSTIVNLILADKTDELLKSNISNSNTIVFFLAYPSKYLHDCINKDLKDKAHSILLDETYSNFDKFLNHENLNNIIKNLKEIILDEENEYKKKFEDDLKQKKEKERQNRINDIQQKIIQYNNTLKNYYTSKIKRESIPDAVNNLNDSFQYLKIYQDLFKNEGYYINRIEYKTSVTISSLNNSKPIEYVNDSKSSAFKFLLFNEYIDEKYCAGVNINSFYFPCIKEEYSNNSKNIEYLINPGFDMPYKAPPILTFGHYKYYSEDFIKNFEKLNCLLNDFEKNLKNVLNDVPANSSSSLFDHIPNIKKQIKIIKPYLNVEFSDKTPAPKTKKIIQDKINIYLENLDQKIDNLNKVLDTDLKPIYNALKTSKQWGKLFDFNYDIIDININSVSNKLPDFSSLKNIDSLASPIFCISMDNKIICSVAKLKCQIGPIFPAYISNRSISINLISFIEGELLVSFDQLSNKQYSNLLKTKEKIANNESVQIFINLPDTTAVNDEIEFKGNLKLETKGIQPFILPFEIKVAILPLKIRLHCRQYPLSKIERNYFRLCCTRVDSKQIIEFELINYYIHNQFIMAVELESLDENKAIQPIKQIDKTKRLITLIMPHVNEPTRCQFDMIVKLSQNFENRIQCDFIITPIVYIFEMYDYCKKSFTSDNCKVIVHSGLAQKLYFRVLFPNKIKDSAKIICKLPDFIINQNHKSYIEFNDDFIFDIDILVNKLPEKILNNYGITLEIGKSKKTIKFDFIEPSSLPFIVDADDEKNTLYLSTFPCYSYLHEDKKWIKITNNKEVQTNKNKNVPYIIISPFSIYTNTNQYTEIKYNLNDHFCIANTQNHHSLFVQVTLSYAYDDFINISNSAEKVEKNKKKIFYNFRLC